jgi:hypothetical protein
MKSRLLKTILWHDLQNLALERTDSPVWRIINHNIKWDLRMEIMLFIAHIVNDSISESVKEQVARRVDIFEYISNSKIQK